jgi:SAM-dependent methyltransferase
VSIQDPARVDAVNLPSAAIVAEALRVGRQVPDRFFDRFLPDDLRALSSDQWTPLEVVSAAASWLREAGVQRVVDIGSGPGKFCVAAALASGCELLGLEQNPRLVSVASSLARLFGVQGRARFVHGKLGDGELPPADAYYLYNPFAQHLFAPGDDLLRGGQPDYERYREDVVSAQDALRRAPTGTIVLSYNGFGGIMPGSYEMCRVSHELPCVLRMWRKSEPWDDGTFSIADAD